MSRCLLIKFSLPEIGGCLSEEQEAWNQLDYLWMKASSCIGYVISLEDALEKEGFNNEFVPNVQTFLQGCLPRVVLGYAILMWFTSKVYYHFQNIAKIVFTRDQITLSNIHRVLQVSNNKHTHNYTYTAQ